MIQGERMDAVLLPTLAALLASASPVVMANDATFGGRGTDLLPLVETRVRMVSEDILLELIPVQDAWQVTARYQFQNPTQQVVSLQLGFPEEACPDDRDCTPQAGQFRDMVTTVRGAEVTHREGKVKAEDGWGGQLGQVYLYDLTFQPGETVEVVHSYRYDRSSGIDWWGTRYLTRTGNLWNGPIDSATFTVRMPQPVRYVIYPREFQLKRYAESPRPDGQGSVTELVFYAAPYAPQVDFSVTFPGPSLVASTPEGLCPGIDGETAPDELDPPLSAWSGPLLRACRNQIYGLHGYPFKDPELRRQHYTPEPLPDWADKAVFTIADRPENPGFAPTWLSPGERALIDAIVAEEQRRKR